MMAGPEDEPATALRKGCLVGAGAWRKRDYRRRTELVVDGT